MLTPLMESRFHPLMVALQKSPFWSERCKEHGEGIRSGSFADVPYLNKAEILANQAKAGPYGTIPSVPSDQIVRVHQSSGTSGTPLVWGDTAGDWTRLLDQWDELFAIAKISGRDRFFFPFSFGPFLGFWSAFEAVARSGRFCLAGGGLTSLARLRFIEAHHISVVLTTPSYANHLAELALKNGMDLVNGPVRKLILAGEPGASMPAVKARLEATWGAVVLDHHGMTEVGPVSMECPLAKGELHLLDDWYRIEALPLPCRSRIGEGNSGEELESELVLTSYSRRGMPLVRYRTGDRVRMTDGPCLCGRIGPRLQGGILGRLDDMMIVRGNNVYPNAIEDWLWSHPEVIDFQGKLLEEGTLSRLILTLELSGSPASWSEKARVLGRSFADRFLFHAEMETVEIGTLPKAEHKSRRWIRGN